MATDADGNYSFTTLVPGHYLNGSTYRPAHIHAKLWVDGAEVITTQLYFRDDPYNSGDALIETSLIMAFTTNPMGDWVAAFDFVLSLP
jgi:protocatechuate 3,4-dioxygenase beta subunit